MRILESNEKTCSKCKASKKLDHFSLVKRTGMNGIKKVHLAYCKVCQSEYSKRRYKRKKAINDLRRMPVL